MLRLLALLLALPGIALVAVPEESSAAAPVEDTSVVVSKSRGTVTFGGRVMKKSTSVALGKRIVAKHGTAKVTAVVGGHSYVVTVSRGSFAIVRPGLSVHALGRPGVTVKLGAARTVVPPGATKTIVAPPTSPQPTPSPSPLASATPSPSPSPLPNPAFAYGYYRVVSPDQTFDIGGGPISIGHPRMTLYAGTNSSSHEIAQVVDSYEGKSYLNAGCEYTGPSGEHLSFSTAAFELLDLTPIPQWSAGTFAGTGLREYGYPTVVRTDTEEVTGHLNSTGGIDGTLHYKSDISNASYGDTTARKVCEYTGAFHTVAFDAHNPPPEPTP